MKRKKSLTTAIDFDDDQIEEDGFIDGDIDLGGDVIESFSFAAGSASPVSKAEEAPLNGGGLGAAYGSELRCEGPVTAYNSELKSGGIEAAYDSELKTAGPEALQSFELNKNTKLPDYRTNHQPYGRTPPVDGEHFEIKRTFMFRRSTVRMLNYLKADHEDENVYLSSIVDEALRFYYKNIFKGKGPV